MTKEFVNKKQIIKSISRETGISQNEAQKIIDSMQKQLINLLLKKQRVLINQFGSFYVYQRKSSTIKQIRTGKKRLIVSQKAVKFRATEHFKWRIKGQPPRRRPFSGGKYNNQSVKIQPTEPAKIKKVSRPKIELKKWGIFQPVSKQRFEEILRKKFIGRKSPAGVSQTTQRIFSDKLIATIFKLVLSQGKKKVTFLINNQQIFIHTTRPKKAIGQIPFELCQRFFKQYLELDDFTIPQERFCLIGLGEKDGIIRARCYFLPLDQGASVLFKIIN